jgi:hypothetical protein
MFEDIIANNLIRNCPVTVDNACREDIIYGTNVATLKHRTVKTQNAAISNYDAVKLPAPIIQRYI